MVLLTGFPESVNFIRIDRVIDLPPPSLPWNCNFRSRVSPALESAGGFPPHSSRLFLNRAHPLFSITSDVKRCPIPIL